VAGGDVKEHVTENADRYPVEVGSSLSAFDHGWIQGAYSPLFLFNLRLFLAYFTFVLPSILTMMHLCIMLYSYWTPLAVLEM